MQFTNPAGSARDAAAGYARALLDVLGDRDPLEVQGELVAHLRAATAGLSGAELRRPEWPGKWSILEVVQHLADSELVCGYRVRMILAHDTPEIQGYDQDLWAERLEYNRMELAESLAQLEVLRWLNLRLLHSLTPEQWERAGIHNERGRESIRTFTRLIAAHDLVHRRQIERIREAHRVPANSP